MHRLGTNDKKANDIIIFFPQNHDKENLPATNIDDVKIIIDDETDGHSPKPGKNYRDSSPDRTRDRSSRDSDSGKREKERISTDRHPDNRDSKRSPRDNGNRDSGHRSSDISRGDHSEKRNETHRHHDNESRSVSEKNERNNSHSHRNSDHSAQQNQDSYPANRLREPRHDEYPSRDRREHSLSPPDAHKPVNPVGRAGSFIKNRDSPRRQSREVRTETESNSVPASGTQGTLSDLKKQRSENHKFGTGLDAQVQNLFLHSLGTGNKYSSGGGHDDSDSNNEKNDKNENMQNGRNIKNNNNNESGGRSRPPTFLSDSGPLRRFSAPTSHPVIGDDDKFKNNCCVIL